MCVGSRKSPLSVIILSMSLSKKPDATTIDGMIVQYQAGANYKELAKPFNVHHTSVMNWLRAIPGFRARTAAEHHRIHQLRQDYFDKIDTQEKAYLLGLLFADGCNTSKFISLDLLDEELVIAFRDSICPSKTQPVFIRIAQKNSYGPGGRSVFCCRPTSVYLCQSLARQGMVPKKSLILKFPGTDVVPEELQRHFIRGYFDGDGCVSFTFERRCPSYAKFSWRMVGTKDFLSVVGEVVKKATNVNYSIRKMRSIFDLYISGNRQVSLVRDWMYADSTISLKRKKDKLDQIVLKRSYGPREN